MKRTLLTLLFAAALLQVAAYEPLRKRVYLFGFATSFTDSVAYITEIQTLDSAYVHYNGFLDSRSLYALQLDQYLAGTGREGLTCVVFFNKKKSKVEKKFLEVKKKHAAMHGVAVSPVTQNEFQFQLEPWVEPQITEEKAVLPPKGKKRGAGIKPAPETAMPIKDQGEGALAGE